jgi:hypothetical protein
MRLYGNLFRCIAGLASSVRLGTARYPRRIYIEKHVWFWHRQQKSSVKSVGAFLFGANL